MTRTTRSRKNNPRIIAAAWRGTISKVDRALSFYRPLVPFCRTLREQGLSYEAIAQQLNDSSYPNIQGHPFKAANIAKLLRRDEQGRLAPSNPRLATLTASTWPIDSATNPDDDDDRWWLDGFGGNDDDPDDADPGAVHNGPTPRPTPSTSSLARSNPDLGGTFYALAGASEWGRDTNPTAAAGITWDAGASWRPEFAMARA